MPLTKNALDLVIKFEVTSEQHYNAKLKNPIWPGEQSGITIGIGYDLGQVTAARFKTDFAALPAADRNALAAVCGKTGQRAKAALASVKTVVVPFQTAVDVFNAVSVPRYQRQMETAMPGVERLDADIQGALWSLVYNRGASMENTDRRREMREIRDAIGAGKPERIPALIRSMIRIWVGTSIEGGMRARREAEAALVESALTRIRMEQGEAEVTPPPQLTRILKLGMSGDDVEALQKILKQLGLLRGSADGDFGPNTLQAVRKFQTVNELDVDGEVGPQTWTELNGEVAGDLGTGAQTAAQKREKLIEIAKAEAALGLTWTNANSDAEKYLKPLRKPMQDLGHIGASPVFFNWCAAFVTFCARKAGYTVPDQPPGASATVALAESWRKWGQHAGTYYKRGTTTPRAGDIVVFEWNDGDTQIDHIGIVTGYDAGTSILKTSEGNRGNKAVNGTRALSSAAGFIRLEE